MELTIVASGICHSEPRTARDLSLTVRRQQARKRELQLRGPSPSPRLGMTASYPVRLDSLAIDAVNTFARVCSTLRHGQQFPFVRERDPAYHARARAARPFGQPGRGLIFPTTDLSPCPTYPILMFLPESKCAVRWRQPSKRFSHPTRLLSSQNSSALLENGVRNVYSGGRSDKQRSIAVRRSAFSRRRKRSAKAIGPACLSPPTFRIGELRSPDQPIGR